MPKSLLNEDTTYINIVNINILCTHWKASILYKPCLCHFISVFSDISLLGLQMKNSLLAFFTEMFLLMYLKGTVFINVPIQIKQSGEKIPPAEKNPSALIQFNSVNFV